MNLFSESRIIICCGSGGVGKTTTSAALGLLAAIHGKKAVIITIDPAKRLATSLGLKSLSNEPADITNLLTLAVGKSISGKVYALMPESEKTLEKFIHTVAKEESHIAQKIFKTSFYKVFAQEFSGMNEYLAMEKLYDIHSQNKFDLIILDTPPSANTANFLEAPQRLAEFFDDAMVKWFLEPSSKIFGFGVRATMGALEKITGKGFIAELLDFISSLFALKKRFLKNLNAVDSLLKRTDVRFLMVTTPERLQKKDTLDFISKLENEGYSFWGLILNKCLLKTLGTLPAGNSPEEKEAYAMLQHKLEVEKAAMEFLENEFKEKLNMAFVPEFSEDIHNVDALKKIADELETELNRA